MGGGSYFPLPLAGSITINAKTTVRCSPGSSMGIHVQNRNDSFWIRKIKHIRKFSYKEEQLIYTVKYNDDLVRISCYAYSILRPFHLFGDSSNAAINLFKAALPNLSPAKG